MTFAKMIKSCFFLRAVGSPLFFERGPSFVPAGVAFGQQGISLPRARDAGIPRAPLSCDAVLTACPSVKRDYGRSDLRPEDDGKVAK